MYVSTGATTPSNDWEDRIYDFDLANVGYWDWDRYRYGGGYTRSEVDNDSTYISNNGCGVATGRFAKALKKMANE